MSTGSGECDGAVADDVGVVAIVAVFAAAVEMVIVMLSFGTGKHHHPVEAAAADGTEELFRSVARMIGDALIRSVVANSVPGRLCLTVD